MNKEPVQPNKKPNKQRLKLAIFISLNLVGIVLCGLAFSLGLPFLYSILMMIIGIVCGAVGFVLVNIQIRRGIMGNLPMNAWSVKTTKNPDSQERIRKLQKARFLPMGLFIVAFGLWVLSLYLGVSHPVVSILIMTIGGLCVGIAVVWSLRVILLRIQIQQDNGEPAKEQLQKRLSKIKWLSIVICTAFWFIISLLLFL